MQAGPPAPAPPRRGDVVVAHGHHPWSRGRSDTNWCHLPRPLVALVERIPQPATGQLPPRGKLGAKPAPLPCLSPPGRERRARRVFRVPRREGPGRGYKRKTIAESATVSFVEDTASSAPSPPPLTAPIAWRPQGPP